MDQGHPKTEYRTTPTKVLFVRRGTVSIRNSCDCRDHVWTERLFLLKGFFPGNGQVVDLAGSNSTPRRPGSSLTSTSTMKWLSLRSIPARLHYPTNGLLHNMELLTVSTHCIYTITVTLAYILNTIYQLNTN
jgi:hypothetical protein